MHLSSVLSTLFFLYKTQKNHLPSEVKYMSQS